MKEKINLMYMNYKEKTKDMTLKEKLVDYIWEYYKLPIIAIIFVGFLVGSYINNVFINPPNKPFGSLSFYGDFVSESVLDSMASELNAALVEPDSGYEVFTHLFHINDADPTHTSVQIQRFGAMMAASELDILFADKADVEGLFESDFCIALNEILSQTELDILNDALINGEDSDLFYGIDLEKVNTDFFVNAGYSVENTIMCVIANTRHPENTAEIIRYMLYQ